MSSRAVQLHRVLRTGPEKVYRAFLEPQALAKWIPPYGFTCQVHHMDVSVGGTFRMSFNNFSTGNGHSFSGEYLELTPHERIRYTDKFEGERHEARSKLRDVMVAAVAWYHDRLLTSPDAGTARRYLRDRGFDGDTGRRYRLG